jgi:hypothetical protein
MTTCEYDSGSRDGNLSCCTSTATVAVSYYLACYGPNSIRLCGRHVDPMKARLYPSIATVEELVK